MHTIPTIPGVKLEVFKQNRLLQPESDGYVGELYSGFAAILAVIDPNADLTVGLFRDGQDHYIQQKELLTLGDMKYGKFPITPAQQFMKSLLAPRSFEPETKVYGIKMPLRVFTYNCKPINTVHYPENMLALAQYVRQGGQLTGRVHVWEVALVSQSGEFFLTVHRHYNIPACKSVKTGNICFPRLQRHRPLEKILVDNAPEGLPLVPAEDIVVLEESHRLKELGRYEGIVDSWYAPRNMGTIITSQGPARVHWSDVPPRPRYRFLKEGEKVKFADLRVPPKNPETEFRKVRKARFQLQACGIEVG